jgi:hypothetical protein
MRSFTYCLAPLFLLGCATTPPPIAEENVPLGKEKVITERGHTVDWLTPRSDVIGIEPGRRHTLGFGGRYHRLNETEKKVISKEINKKADSPEKIATNDKDVWSRFCSGEPLTEEEHKGIEYKTPPKKWLDAGKCRPAK